jgi:hypothetical protein
MGAARQNQRRPRAALFIASAANVVNEALFREVTLDGETLTRWTVRLSLLLYAATLALRLSRPARRRPARGLWTLGCLLFLAHVAAAFHYFHGWSHRRAWAETARQTGEMFGTDWGGGLYLNYLFTLAWAADVAWWWRGLGAYDRRPRWVGMLLHGFMFFMAFNATVLFERGPVRWVAAGGTVLLTVLALRRRRRSNESAHSTA